MKIILDNKTVLLSFNGIFFGNKWQFLCFTPIYIFFYKKISNHSKIAAYYYN